MDEKLKTYTRERFIELLMIERFGYEEMFRVVQMYIFYRKQEKWEPRNINLNDLQVAFDYARNWMSVHFELNILRDKKEKVIKIF